jgi:hypothetical protein
VRRFWRLSLVFRTNLAPRSFVGVRLRRRGKFPSAATTDGAASAACHKRLLQMFAGTVRRYSGGRFGFGLIAVAGDPGKTDGSTKYREVYCC